MLPSRQMSQAVDNLQDAQQRAMAGHTQPLVPTRLPEPLPYKGRTRCSPGNRDALIAALRTDQAGNSSFQEFLAASWRAGVVRYDVDFAARKVTYYGCSGEEHIEDYPAVDVD
jgi:uncharacterized protein YbcV (DUF1398 family)